LRSDDARLNDSLAAAGLPLLSLDLASRAQFSEQLRASSGHDSDIYVTRKAVNALPLAKAAIRTGTFPALPEERFQQVGNAAGTGARQLLVSLEMREKALDIRRRERYIELTTHPGFSDLFVRNIGFEPVQ
jgi:uncharacterized 2Fe-2S/4Fe-4S cluster protein (DUF4445 family)